MENFDEFGVYSNTSDWASGNTVAGNSSSGAIDWNAILQGGIPRLFDLAQTSMVLENGRPVLTGDRNATRTAGAAPVVSMTQETLLLLVLGAVVVFVLVRK